MEQAISRRRRAVDGRVCWVTLTLLIWCGASFGQDGGRQVLVVYHSVKGHTESLARAVAEGARGVEGTRVRLISVAQVEEADLLAADAIVVGSPVINANVAPEVQSFINGWPFRGAPLRDKIGAAFAAGGGISAGEELVQLSLLRSMLVFGMVVAGGSHWTSAFGASAVTEEPPFPGEVAEGQRVAERFLKKGRALGRRVAELAASWSPPARDAKPQPEDSAASQEH